MGKAFGGSDNGGFIGMVAMTFMLDMPVVSILHFRENAWLVSPEDIVDGLLKRAYTGEYSFTQVPQ